MARDRDASQDLRARVERMITRGEADASDQDAVLLEELRDARQFALMLPLAEAIARKRPGDAQSRRLYAQALIEEGQVTAAIDMLERLAARLVPGHAEHAESLGLLGRAHKQIFFDANDKTSAVAQAALRGAIAAYRKPFERDANPWHGANLVALTARAERDGVRVRGLKSGAVARRVMEVLDAMPDGERNDWYHATRAEVALGLGQWDVTLQALRSYVGTPAPRAFMIASTLRQFTQLWDLESEPSGRGAGLVSLLRARLLEVSGGEVRLEPAMLMQSRKHPEPDRTQLEAVLGKLGTKTWQWWKTGLDRATGVCVVRSKMGERVGTGWLVRAGDLNRSPPDELLVLTNYHVINEQGAAEGITPDNAEVVFEAVDAQKAYAVQALLWCSPEEKHDASLLRLSEPIAGIRPLQVAKALPLVDDTARVYVIGYPGGRSLAFSLQDNELLEHEGPPGTPAIEGVCRVHYRAPTEGGSSGSPVFNASGWEVIAMHHKGGKLGMPRLNGKPGTHAANEGISLASIIEAMAAG